MTTGLVQVQTTFDSEATARQLADSLVNERLAACVQILGPIRSTYRWKGAVEHSTEWLCLIKTTESTLPGLLPRLREQHPYETPEIIVIPVVDGDPDYLRWVGEEVRGER